MFSKWTVGVGQNGRKMPILAVYKTQSGRSKKVKLNGLWNKTEGPKAGSQNWCFQLNLWLAEFQRAPIWLAGSRTNLALFWKPFLGIECLEFRILDLQLKIAKLNIRAKLNRFEPDQTGSQTGFSIEQIIWI